MGGDGGRGGLTRGGVGEEEMRNASDGEGKRSRPDDSWLPALPRGKQRDAGSNPASGVDPLSTSSKGGLEEGRVECKGRHAAGDGELRTSAPPMADSHYYTGISRGSS